MFFFGKYIQLNSCLLSFFFCFSHYKMIVPLIRLNIFLSGGIGITANFIVLIICFATKPDICKESRFIIIFQTLHALFTICVNIAAQLVSIMHLKS